MHGAPTHVESARQSIYIHALFAVKDQIEYVLLSVRQCAGH
ncbi:hypothetical protein Heshes_24890 [Alicyclobacillus hesperidum]|uniref:Uncharacterized protein n=1 Tax=Alicyclobacillus hesperidum TaxID=89784 RepID=A0AA37U4V6_9BACL|nr:hypothetical protein Heshes_24890 [Alicyclobacillus hesperidum]